MAAKDAMKILWANASRAVLIAGLGGAFMFVGKCFIIAGTLFCCYWIFENVDDYESMSSIFWPMFVIFFIGLAISILFMSVYGMAIDAIL